MAVDVSLITAVGVNIEYNPPPKGVAADQFSLPILIKPLGTGKHIYKSRTLLYTVDTGGASIGDSFIQVAETIDPKTPSAALVSVGGAEWIYSSLDTANRRFILDTTEHPTGLTVAYSATTEVSLTNDTTITIDASEAEFNYQGSTADQIVFEADPEFNLTLIIPANESANYSFTAAEKPILINSGAGQLWNPTVDLPYTCRAWIAASVNYESDLINNIYYWYDLTGDFRLKCDNPSDAPDLVDGATKYVSTNAEGWTLQEQTSPGVWADRDFNETGDTVDLFAAIWRHTITSQSSFLRNDSTEYRLNVDGGTDIRMGPSSNDQNWDGYSENGLLVTNQAIYGSGTSPGRSPIGNVVSLLMNMNLAVNRIFGRDNQSTLDFANEVTAFLYVPAQESITQAEQQLMIRWLWAQARANGYTRDPDPTLANGTQAPTAGTLGTITVQVPTVTLTITNIPETAEVRIYDLDGTLPDFGTELAGIENLVGTSFEYSHSKSGDDIMLQIFADGFKELNQRITLSSVSQTVNVAELLEAEDAL